MIDSSKKHNHQLAFELQNLHVCEKRSNLMIGSVVVNFQFFFFWFRLFLNPFKIFKGTGIGIQYCRKAFVVSL